jgi:hypothetical protein
MNQTSKTSFVQSLLRDYSPPQVASWKLHDVWVSNAQDVSHERYSTEGRNLWLCLVSNSVDHQSFRRFLCEFT